MSYRAPKAISSHPGVEEVRDAVADGFDDYRHNVWLKEGWCFTRGRMTGGRSGNFQAVHEFRYANPQRETDT